jgi:hypothetical protein
VGDKGGECEEGDETQEWFEGNEGHEGHDGHECDYVMRVISGDEGD